MNVLTKTSSNLLETELFRGQKQNTALLRVVTENANPLLV
jgi:hypothetical protein